jgi:DNA (cytosine-5)-methyltransferase 1
MAAYYNEFDPHAAAWLRELIKQGHIADGDVDDRDMREVSADELKGYTQHHFFAGIGGWSLALRIAGWDDSRPVLTGSPPCQPFSTAGQRKGAADERHLAPTWLELVAALRPSWVFGEQVAAAINKDNWLDDLLDALEAEGYTTGALVLPACGIGAPHIRQRLWITGRLADSIDTRHEGRLSGRKDSQRQDQHRYAGRDCSTIGMADTADDGYIATKDRRGVREEQEKRRLQQSKGARSHGRMANATDDGYTASDGLRETLKPSESEGKERERQSQGSGNDNGTHALETQWNDPDWLACRDGKWRPVEPSTFPLADGVSARVGRLRGYGNAIVPQVAAQIIKAVM